MTDRIDDGSVTAPMRPVDVAVVGDGPAGLAVAAACADAGLTVRLHGEGRPWTATYATWRDDVAMLPDSVFASITPLVDVVGASGNRRRLERAYAVLDNDALRDHLVASIPADAIAPGRVDDDRLSSGPDGLHAEVVVFATGAPSPARSWQTAFGVVVDEIPPSLDADASAVTLMDWRQPPSAEGPPSFCYVVPVHDGWLVEETVLAATPAVDPAALRARLVARLGGDAGVVDRSTRVEEVRIPMGSPRATDHGTGTVAFGAAAALIHPATGYSVAASLRAAPRLAAAIAAGDDPGSAVWPRPYRRSRVLHTYGLGALLRLDADATGDFFDAFFELPVERWAAYLRVDVTPGEIAGVMTRVFRRAPWRVRRRLMAGDPRMLWRLLVAA